MTLVANTTLRSTRDGTELPDAAADLSLLAALTQRARQSGADAAEAMLRRGRSLAVTHRLGKTEALESADAIDVGLRVFVGRRQALVSSSDLAAASITQLVDRAMAMVRVVPKDPFCGLAPAELLVGEAIDVDACDPVEPAPEALQALAAEAEAAALTVPGVTNSEGAEAGWATDRMAMVTSNGFARTFSRSQHSLSVSVLAGTGDGMERDYDYAVTAHGEALPEPATIGQAAAERAVRRLAPRKVKTSVIPVIFDPRVSRSLLSHLTGAITGPSVARGTTFLKHALGTQVFGEGITIIDDPLRPRGLRSHPFDAEGLAVSRRAIVEHGVLTTWFLDLASARQLRLAPTGHATRGAGSLPAPAPSNLFLAAGAMSPAELYADVKEGLYLTELIGFGVNGVTGDYSRGASGFWMENGGISYAVNEVTVSGNLIEMFRRLVPANDLVYRFGVDAPTVRIDGMTVAGR